jgi:hypothetical protein
MRSPVYGRLADNRDVADLGPFPRAVAVAHRMQERMSEWIVREDERYRSWLEDHPDGFVINTEVARNPSNIRLHKAACRTINRSLPSSMSWTMQYRKAVSVDSADLARWAIERTGVTPPNCRLCGGTA